MTMAAPHPAMAASLTMAAEFPDVFQLFDSPNQKTVTVGKDRNYAETSEYVRTGSESTKEEKTINAKRRRGTDPGPSGRKKQITSRDAGRNEGSGRRTGGGKDEGVNIYNDHSYSSDAVVSLPSHTSPSLADIDDILSSLGQQDDSVSSSLYLTKAAFGCSWGGPGRSCSHGELCPFVRQYLGLSDLSEHQLNPAKSDATTNNQENKENRQNVQRVVVVRQTSQGLVKVNEVLQSVGGGGRGEQGPPGAGGRGEQGGREEQGPPGAGGRGESSSQQSWDSAPSYSLQLRPEQMQLFKNQNTRVTLATGQPAKNNAGQVRNPNQMGQQMRHSNQMRQQQQTKPGQHNRMEQLFQYNDASSQQSLMRAVNASNSNVTAKCPSVSPTFVPSSTPSPTPMFPTPSPSPPTAGDLVTTKMMYPCAQCGSDFFDSKSLTKHTRNHHQPYTCTKPGCDEQTVGYYRMALHTKAAHKKTPSFACECGRNFAEKKGLTKHQNNCLFHK